MLKFEGLEVGTVIKAMDHRPLDDGEELFIKGEIISICEPVFKCYEIVVSEDTCFPESHTRVGKTVLVPMQTMIDFDNRITAVS